MQTCLKCGFSNPDAAKFCANCGIALEVARPVEGERRFATVLFADVARSTTIAEQMDPEDWAGIMHGAFAFMNAAVSHYGGTVSRLMGDAVLALFGAPVAHEDDAERAVRAGLEMQDAAMRYATGIKQQHGVDFDLRVGINTGTAVLAFVGDAIKTEYTALGDAANVAARLQSAAEPGTVLISADTHKLVHALFDFRPRGRIDMKGKTEAVECYEVTGIKAVPEATRGLAGLSSPLVGREREIGLLRDRLVDLTMGIGSVVAVVGEAGLGKSRLLAELRHLRDALPEPRPIWRETRAISYGQAIPYYPWRQLGRVIVGADDMDAAPAVREKIAAWVERLGLKPTDIPFYETMIAVEGDASRATLRTMSGETVVNGVAAAIVNAIKSVMHADNGMTPYVMVMDDLHWSDSATLELIAQVATLAAFEPILLVTILRPDRKAASWQLLDRLQGSLGSSFSRLDLEPLDAAGSSQLLGNLLHIEDLPESIRAQILERSEGNPFYLEEVLRSLIDGGQVVREGEHWRATRDIIEATIPDTLAGVLSSRIDRLPDTTKRVAQTAAVIGRVFQHRVLESVLQNGPAPERIEHIEPHLATLSYEQLVREKARDPEREYIFKHALTCEAAYDLLLRSRRRDLHARCGSALETLFAERRDEFAAMLAHHFEEAGDLERTLQYARVAADTARRVYAVREELEHRDRILATLEKMPGAMPADLIDAVLEWAWVRNRRGQYEGMLEKIEKAVQIARELGDKRRLGLTLSWMGNVHMVTGFPSRGFPYLEEAQALATETGDDQVLLLPLFIATWSLVERDARSGEEKLAKVIEMASKQDAPDILGHALTYRAIALARLGQFDEASALVEEALALIPTIGSAVKQADVHIGAGMAYYDMGDIEKGLEHAHLGADLAMSNNGLECACAGYFGVGRGELDKRNIDDALVQFRRSLKLADAVGMDYYINMIRAGVAEAEFEQGSTGSIEKLRSAIDNARSTDDDFVVAVLAMPFSRALLRLERASEARETITSAIAYFRRMNLKPYLANALSVLGDVTDALGERGVAAEARDEAASLRDEIKLPPPATALPHIIQA
ncbi:MAG TPA: adenylate/guanylate cyclase domain-containing protein [Devosia sp.]|uniref:adenylate/guanylate cyclase domain-containing protein n=1 Tax=Devosia sp. TaxID=1871048 RepID=UPI002DDD8022|nr:adenylate/guanylate cyclase domain-containing protein [Devosia sp.]HEV2514424.1 adenylate/guanylate cyclase domain-containing protein [Devosia sp.]